MADGLRYLPILILLALACAPQRAGRTPNPDVWTSQAAVRIARKLRLDDSTVRMRVDPSPYDWVLPTVWVVFSGSALKRIGYTDGTVNVDALLKAGWQEVPARLKVEELGLEFRWPSEAYGNTYMAAELDARWPRRR